MLDIRAGFAVLRARFGLPLHAARTDAPFCWGEEKLTAHRHRLERQLAAIATEHRAVMRDHDRRTGDLQRRRDACLIELAMTDLHALAAQRQGNPNAAESAPAPGALAPPAREKTGGVPNEPGSAETPTLPLHVADPGNAPAVPASLSVAAPGSAPDHAPPGAPILPDPASTAPAETDGDDAIPDREARHALVEAAAPGWRDVRSPPESVRQRFPFFAMPIAPLADLDRRDLIELVWLLPKEHNDLIRSTPFLEDHPETWLLSEDGAACRAALEHTIAREESRRAVWDDLLDGYWCVLDLVPNGSKRSVTPQQVEEAFNRLELECRNALTPEHYEVWHELMSLLPKRPWSATGNAAEAVIDEGDLHDLPDDGDESVSVYDDDAFPGEAAS